MRKEKCGEREGKDLEEVIDGEKGQTRVSIESNAVILLYRERIEG